MGPRCCLCKGVLLRQLWAALLLVVADGWGSLSMQQDADISLFPSSSTPECSKTNFLAMDFTIWDTAPYGRLFNQLIQFRNAWYLAHMMGTLACRASAPILYG